MTEMLKKINALPAWYEKKHWQQLLVISISAKKWQGVLLEKEQDVYGVVACHEEKYHFAMLEALTSGLVDPEAILHLDPAQEQETIKLLEAKEEELMQGPPDIEHILNTCQICLDIFLQDAPLVSQAVPVLFVVADLGYADTLHLPKLPIKEIENLLPREIAERVPMPEHSYQYSYEIKTKDEEQEVKLAALSDEICQGLQDIATQKGLPLAGICLPDFLPAVQEEQQTEFWDKFHPGEREKELIEKYSLVLQAGITLWENLPILNFVRQEC